MLDLTTLLVLGLATAAITITVTKSHLFAGVVEWAAEKSPRLGRLLSCPWCFSHWAAALVMLLWWVGYGSPVYWSADRAYIHGGVVGLLLTWLAIVAVSGIAIRHITGGADG